MKGGSRGVKADMPRGPTPVNTGQEWCLGPAACPCLQGTRMAGQLCVPSALPPVSTGDRSQSWPVSADRGIVCDSGG